jgi:DMSO/TMAO reductase YedYZ molybdopterin-dependent catalytic subunit
MMETFPEVSETDPLAPRSDERVLPPRWIGGVVGLSSGIFAVVVGMVVAALGNSRSSFDLVGSSFIDRTPPWLKEQAIQTFGTNNKVALEIGMIGVLIIASGVLGLLSRKRLTPLRLGIVIFGIIGTLSAIEQSGAGFISIIAPLCGVVAGLFAARLLHGYLTTQRSLSRTPQQSRVPLGWDRRSFIRTVGALGVLSGGGVLFARGREQARVEQLEDLSRVPLPPLASGDAPVIPATEFHPTDPYITPNENFYRIDTALSFPRVDRDTWKLRVRGLVERESLFSMDDLQALPQVERIITLCCVSNVVGGPLIGNAVWRGVLLKDVLKLCGLKSNAEQVFSTSLDGWTSGFPVSAAMDGRDALIAIGMNGEPLPLRHGYPARLVVPGLYGYVSATKWLSEINITTWSAQQGYWIPRGWSREAPVKTHSRIDVPRQGEKVSVGKFRLAGVAWAQHTGVQKVEIRIDRGAWQSCDLGIDLTDDAWRQWIFDWYATVGEHTIQVRTTDKSGYIQTEEVRRVDPDGATGWHTRTVRVV